MQLRPSPYLLRVLVALLLGGSTFGFDGFRYFPVNRQVVEARLGKYGGDNERREATLKQMFVESGCEGKISRNRLLRTQSCRMLSVSCRAIHPR
jgi:hypothetical protein